MYDFLSPLQLGVYFTFILTFLGLVAGSVFFFSQKSLLRGEYQQGAILSGVICLVAAVTYYYMQGTYLAGAREGEKAFPTIFRYLDWFITVPLMLTKFPVLLGLGSRGTAFMTRLIVASVLMLALAFIGELNIQNAALHYGTYAVSCVFWLYILWALNNALQQLPDGVDEEKRLGIRGMFILILIGWVIYPVGYLMPTFNLAADYRELLYNVGDLINKVGLGLILISTGFKSQRAAGGAV